MRQEMTRAHKGWALDNVVLDNEVTKIMKEDVNSAPGQGTDLLGISMLRFFNAVSMSITE